MTYSFVSAVNDDAVLASSLLRSPDIAPGVELLLQRGFPSASSAYNRALEKATGNIVIFVHQDVYLPPGWLHRLGESLRQLDQTDPSWGALGICGLAHDGSLHSWVYSAGLDRVLGAPFAAPEQVRTLDEVLLVIRRSSGLRFDERLAGFHMYATDLCLEAEKRNLRNYVVPCFAFHNSNGIKNLPWAFWRACLFVRRKWWRKLPVRAPCTTVSRVPWRPVRQMVERFLLFTLRGRRVGQRHPDPVAACADLEKQGLIPPLS